MKRITGWRRLGMEDPEWTEAMKSDITSFYHCAKCIKEVPKGMSPRDYASIEVGPTSKGTIQVWCKRHEIEIISIKVGQQNAPHACDCCESDWGEE